MTAHLAEIHEQPSDLVYAQQDCPRFFDSLNMPMKGPLAPGNDKDDASGADATYGCVFNSLMI